MRWKDNRIKEEMEEEMGFNLKYKKLRNEVLKEDKEVKVRKRRKLTPGSSQRLDLFIKVLRLLCP